VPVIKAESSQSDWRLKTRNLNKNWPKTSTAR
jgi:hypothetical protein